MKTRPCRWFFWDLDNKGWMVGDKEYDEEGARVRGRDRRGRRRERRRGEGRTVREGDKGGE